MCEHSRPKLTVQTNASPSQPDSNTASLRSCAKVDRLVVCTLGKPRRNAAIRTMPLRPVATGPTSVTKLPAPMLRSKFSYT